MLVKPKSPFVHSKVGTVTRPWTGQLKSWGSMLLGARNLSVVQNVQTRLWSWNNFVFNG